MTASLLDGVRGTLEGIAWPPILDGPAASVLALARQLEQSQWLDAETHRRRQFGQLERTASWLAKHSPAFARRLNDAGLDAHALGTPAGLAALPPIDRRWFQSEPDLASDAVPPGHTPLGETVTSGSTGEFLRVLRTRPNQLLWLAMVMRDHGWRRTDFSLPLVSVRANNMGISQHASWGPPVSLLFDTGPAMRLPINLTGDDLFDRLNEFRTGNLVIYPNALRVLLGAAEARGGIGTLRAIRTVGEVVTPELRDRTRTAFGIEIADAYTSQELGYIALQCPESELYHVMSETVLVEVLRADGTPCGEGETGTVAVTDLHNHATPIVRYALGDLAETGGTCSCGRALPTLRRIAGRSRNLLLLPDGNRVWPNLGGFGPEGFLHVLPIVQYQCIQTVPDRLEVRVHPSRPFSPEEEQLLLERMRRALRHPFNLEIRYFEQGLPPSPSGKFEDFICLV